MVNVVRAVVVGLLAVTLAALLSVSLTMATTVQLLASYALKGTQGGPYGYTTDQQIQQEAILYISGIPVTGAPHNVPMPVTVVQYPASSSNPPFDESVAEGLAALQADTAGDPDPVIYGFSQGAVVASEYKKAYNADPTSGTIPVYYLTGNPNRPNGGAFTRSGDTPTPTETTGAAPGQITTYDISGQYDPTSDRPTNPFNLFAALNSQAALYVHLNYRNVDTNDVVLQGTYGDTAYYLIPTYPLPLLVPVQQIPLVGPTITDVLDPVLRVLVEAAYDRTTNPGVPTPYNPFYGPNPINLAVNSVVAVAVGVGVGLQDILGLRTPGTAPSYLTGPGAVYSVGGPTVTLPNQEAPALPAAAQSAESTPASQTAAAVEPSPVDAPAKLPSLLDPARVVAQVETAAVDRLGTRISDVREDISALVGAVVPSSPTATPTATSTSSTAASTTTPTAASTTTPTAASTTTPTAAQEAAPESKSGAPAPDKPSPRSAAQSLSAPPATAPTRVANKPAAPTIRRQVGSQGAADKKPPTSPRDTFKKPTATSSEEAASPAKEDSTAETASTDTKPHH